MVVVDYSRSSRRMRKLTEEFKAECREADAVCWLCLQLIDYDADPTIDDYAFQLDHYFPWSTHKELREDPENFRASHRLCNITRGNELPRPGLGTTSRDWF